jgi:electron transfer flavoprotein beta subunit
MHILVCIKQVPDPEGPKEAFQINQEDMRVMPSGIPPVMSLFDENALEGALQIKDSSSQAVKISIVSIGKKISAAVMMRGLAAGADELIVVQDAQFDLGRMDSLATARVLQKTIEKIGDVDLILMGRQSADWNCGQTGIFLGAEMNIPCITLGTKIEVDGDGIKVQRLIPDGQELIKTGMPAVVMVSNEIGELRYPSMKERRLSKKKPVVKWQAGDIGMNALDAPKLALAELISPVFESKECQMVEGASPDEMGKRLATILKEESVL